MVRAAPRIAVMLLALGASAAGAWGPSGVLAQPNLVVATTAQLRALARVNPSAAKALVMYMQGRGGTGLGWGRLATPGIDTAQTVELALRQEGDPAAYDRARRALPAADDVVETAWQSRATPAGGLDVTFRSRILDGRGADVAAAFPAVTVQLAAGDPPLVAGWRLAGPADEAAAAPQGPLAVPVPVARLPAALDPQAAIVAYSRALLRQDVSMMAAMASEALAQRMGGRDQVRTWWQHGLDAGLAWHTWPIAEQINDIRALPTPSMNLWLVQATRWYEGWPKPVAMSWVYLLSTRDRGRRWEVLDVVNVNRDWLHAVAPDFHDDARVADILP